MGQQPVAQNEEAPARQGNLLGDRRRPAARRRQASSSAAQNLKEEVCRRTASVARVRTGPAVQARFPKPPGSAEGMPLRDMRQSAAHKEEASERTIHLLSCV